MLLGLFMRRLILYIKGSLSMASMRRDGIGRLLIKHLGLIRQPGVRGLSTYKYTPVLFHFLYHHVGMRLRYAGQINQNA